MVIKKLNGITTHLVSLVLIVLLITSVIFVFLGPKTLGIRPFVEGLILPGLPGCRENKMSLNDKLPRLLRRIPLMMPPVIMTLGLRKPFRFEPTTLCQTLVLINAIQTGLTTLCQTPGLIIAKRGSFHGTQA